ncbi:hypothetical protein [Streptomyces sp. PvR034]|uniref:hypothetical protein n=1 Tax=Streptomyces sp. PvR034 TaxID=3156401 RepID=UPI00339575A3
MNNEVSTRPGSATGAGVMGIAFGLAAVGGAVYVLLLLGEGNGFGLFGLPVLAFGVGTLRAGAKVLTGVSYSGDRLSRLALMPASLSGIAIGAMVASADWGRRLVLPPTGRIRHHLPPLGPRRRPVRAVSYEALPRRGLIRAPR